MGQWTKRINTEEMQIETLLNDTVEKAKELMGGTNSSGKMSIALSKLMGFPKVRSEIPAIKTITVPPYVISELENGTIEIKSNGEYITPARPILRELAKKNNIAVINSNGNLYNTRQLGSLLIKVLVGESDDSA